MNQMPSFKSGHNSNWKIHIALIHGNKGIAINGAKRINAVCKMQKQKRFAFSIMATEIAHTPSQ